MKLNFRVGVSLVALLAVGVMAPNSASAADVMGAECSLHAAVTGGGLLGSQSYDVDDPDAGSFDNSSWSAMFAEAAGLATCGSWNVQGDFAYYDHTTDDIAGKDDGSDVDLAASHFGGAVFWRDPERAAFGLSGSYITQEVYSKDNEYYRVGLFGEYFANDRLTFGGSANYLNGSLGGEGDSTTNTGFEIAAYARFYATPDFALSLRGDYLNSSLDFNGKGDDIPDYNGFAVTAEAEYLVWDQGLSLLGGARYAMREISLDGDSTGFDDMQVYAGVKIALGGSDGTLVGRDRTGTYDNTSVMMEKLPSWIGSVAAAESSMSD